MFSRLLKRNKKSTTKTVRICVGKKFFKLLIYLQMHWFNVLYAIVSIFLSIIANLNCVETVQKAFYIWFIVGRTSMWRSVVFIVVLVLVLGVFNPCNCKNRRRLERTRANKYEWSVRAYKKLTRDCKVTLIKLNTCM